MLPGASATFINNTSFCPHCGSAESIPNGTFRATVEGLIKVITSDENPLATSVEFLDALKQVKTTDDLVAIKQGNRFAKLQKWLPDSPEKIAAYIMIISTLVHILQGGQSSNIEYNTFVNEYNQTITINTGDSRP
jgi:hypothetical protein